MVGSKLCGLKRDHRCFLLAKNRPKDIMPMQPSATRNTEQGSGTRASQCSSSSLPKAGAGGGATVGISSEVVAGGGESSPNSSSAHRATHAVALLSVHSSTLGQCFLIPWRVRTALLHFDSMREIFVANNSEISFPEGTHLIPRFGRACLSAWKYGRRMRQRSACVG